MKGAFFLISDCFMKKEILLSTKEIEQEIVKKLYNDDYKSLLLILQHYTSKDKATDIIQEAFIILSENAKKLNLLRPPVPYLRMIAINLVKKMHLNVSKRGELALEALVGYELSDQKVNIVRKLEQKEMTQFLFGIIESFPEKKRFVANLRIREDLQYDTVSELVGISSRTAKRYMKKIKEQIRVDFEKHYPEQTRFFLEDFC